ncbi:hypothetical protein [Streptomyces inhibens]|uniref:hypothetical protein n=1 Tax=Streptomyces inhibens TaxID=2293571 RepID=UPI001EE71F92|nr:hypothetical protein [Streptomyces inhibens]UKY47843.1 hypothetical protein KI385_02695 [Streptomyces inhibens]
MPRSRPFELLGAFSAAEGLGADQRDLMRTVPRPSRSAFEQRLTGPGELGPDVDRVVVACDDAKTLLDAAVPTPAFLNHSPWRRFDLPTGHWPMLSTPVELADTLDAVVSSGR